MIEIVRGDPFEVGVRALIEDSHGFMAALFPAEENHFLSLKALSGPDIRLFVARLDGVLSGVGGLALRKGYGEVKTLYVAPEARKSGIASALMARIETEARELALPWLRLETGDKLAAALRLYAAMGFVPCRAFGDYSDAAKTSVYLEKRLR